MKDVLLSSIARVAVILLQLINVKLYTHYLTIEQIGMFFFLLALSYSANALLFVPVDYYQQAKMLDVIKHSGGIRPILDFNLKLTGFYLGFSILSLLICSVARPNDVSSVLLVVVLAYVLYLVQALRNTLNNLEYRRFVSISFIQEAALKVLISYVALEHAQSSALWLVLAWVVALVCSGTYLLHRAYQCQLFVNSSAYPISIKEVFHFAYPFSIGAVCNWLQLQGYRLILVPLGFTEEVGIFATVSSIGAAAIGAASLIYSQQFTPLIYKTFGKYTATYLQGALAVIAFVSVVALGLGEFMVSILTNAGFEPHWKLLLFGVMTDGANLIIGALVIHITLAGNTKRIIGSSLLGLFVAVICFGMLYVFAKIIAVTIGIPLLIAQWSVVIFMYMNYRQKTH